MRDSFYTFYLHPFSPSLLAICPFPFRSSFFQIKSLGEGQRETRTERIIVEKRQREGEQDETLERENLEKARTNNIYISLYHLLSLLLSLHLLPIFLFSLFQFSNILIFGWFASASFIYLHRCSRPHTPTLTRKPYIRLGSGPFFGRLTFSQARSEIGPLTRLLLCFAVSACCNSSLHCLRQLDAVIAT